MPVSYTHLDVYKRQVQIACNATLLTFGGDIYISVMTVLNSVRQIAQTPVMAIADGATAVISFNYGAKAYSRVRGALRFMTQLAFGYTALSWLLISLFPAAFIRIFNQDAAMLRAAIPSLHIYFFGFVMMAFQYSGQSTFKSVSYTHLSSRLWVLLRCGLKICHRSLCSMVLS